ncbi:hypothetical protein QUB70_04765 [Microcoleus sp. A003_D6]
MHGFVNAIATCCFPTSYTIFPRVCRTYFTAHPPEFKALGETVARPVAASGKIGMVLPAQK